MEDPEASGGREAVPEEIRKVRAGGARNFYLEADWSLERYELEKQKKLLIILQKETNFLKKEPEVLEKLK